MSTRTKQVVSSPVAISRPTQQSTEAARLPRKKQHITPTKTVLATCLYIVSCNNSDNWNNPFRWWEGRKHHFFCVAGHDIAVQYIIQYVSPPKKAT